MIPPNIKESLIEAGKRRFHAPKTEPRESIILSLAPNTIYEAFLNGVFVKIHNDTNEIKTYTSSEITKNNMRRL